MLGMGTHRRRHLVPKLRLGTHVEKLRFSSVTGDVYRQPAAPARDSLASAAGWHVPARGREAELRSRAFPSGAWERGESCSMRRILLLLPFLAVFAYLPAS